MSNMQNEFIKRISLGLKRQSIAKCSDWSCRYRIMGKPFPGRWTFKYHPWLRDMHDSKAEINIGQKSAQVGYTETLLNWTFYNIDIEQNSVLYILPSNDNAGEFTSTRFDPALEASPHLKTLFTNVKNIKLKRAGTASLYIRGSRVKNNLKSVPVGRVACDEVDEMVVDNLPSAWERMSGHTDKQRWLISTPTVEDFGINSYFTVSNEQHYFFKCPHCGKFIELLPKENMDFTRGILFCHLCKTPLNKEEKLQAMRDTGEWVAQNDSEVFGWYLNQLYSFTVTPQELKIAYDRAKVDPAAEQELYNSKFGLPHVVEGARVTDSNIKEALGNYQSSVNINPEKIRTMGIDVGKFLHFEICEWDIIGSSVSSDVHILARPRVLRADKVEHFEDIDMLVKEYLPTHTVIDAMPERRKSKELCDRFPGMVTMCYYSETSKHREINQNADEKTITVNRTMWLDLSLGRFMQQRIKLPGDISEEYKKHLMNLVKRYDKDAMGNTVARYINTGDDHFGHARNYCELALSLAVGQGENSVETGINR